MTPQLTALILVILLGALISLRLRILRQRGLTVIHFGKLDKTDFIIPPFALFYFYHILANAFGFPSLSGDRWVKYPVTEWLGIVVALVGLVFAFWGLISLKNSLRIGIDVDQPGDLITAGAFAVSRNPIYVGFLFFMLGQFLVYPALLFLIYFLGAVWLMDRQIRREEDFMRQHYGEAFARYSERVKRYL